MPNNNKRGNRFKSKKPKKRNTRISHASSSSTRGGPSIRRYPGLRSFEFFSPNFKSSQPENNWLSNLLAFGAIALKFFAYAYGYVNYKDKVFATNVVTSAAQGLIFGAEDLLYNTPIAETVTHENKPLVRVDYNQARVTHVTFTLTPGAELSKRAGRYVVAVVPLTYDQAARYCAETSTSRTLVTEEKTSYEKLVGYPGAITCSADKPTRISLRLTGHASAWHEIGSYTVPSDLAKFRGGLPLVKYLFAYQDMASANNKPENLYSADEALFQLDVAGSIMLREPGEKYLRDSPIATQVSSKVGVTTPFNRQPVDVPLDSFEIKSGYVLCPAFPGVELLQDFGFVNSKGSLPSSFEDLSLAKI